MVFSDSTTGQGIVEMARRLTNTDANTYPINDLTANINSVYSDYVSILLSSDTRWEWDDANFTTFPIATTDLKSGQRDYQFQTNFLKILKVLIMQPGNNDFQEIDEIDVQDSRSNLEAWSMNINSQPDNQGIPDTYDLFADTLRLQPVPNYSQTGGIKVFFQRYESSFTPTDTTKEPGFAHPFHIGLAYGAAHLFAMTHMLPNVNLLNQKDMECREALKEYMSERNKSEKPRISFMRTNSK